jgi:hypothetical protein
MEDEICLKVFVLERHCGTLWRCTLMGDGCVSDVLFFSWRDRVEPFFVYYNGNRKVAFDYFIYCERKVVSMHSFYTAGLRPLFIYYNGTGL